MTDVLIVCTATTAGWRAVADELAGAITRAGATVQTVTAAPQRRVRTFALTDLLEARAAREACRKGIAAHRPQAIIYCSITAALLWPTPGAVALDSIAAENRPGRHGVWQRPLERRRLARAPLVLASTERALAPLLGPHGALVVIPPAVEVAPPARAPRELAAVAYAADPDKRRLGLVLEAWARARRAGETLVVTGVERLPAIDGVRAAGLLPGDEFRALLRRARAFVTAPRREDFGIAALEALANGCQLVSTPSPGPYPALALARELDGRLVSDDLGAALRIALDDPRPGYALQAAALLAPYRREAIDQRVARDVLPRLLAR
ncbi:MAG: glycosyltransferase [Solirubrobacteraceae bacterium]